SGSWAAGSPSRATKLGTLGQKSSLSGGMSAAIDHDARARALEPGEPPDGQIEGIDGIVYAAAATRAERRQRRPAGDARRRTLAWQARAGDDVVRGVHVQPEARRVAALHEPACQLAVDPTAIAVD